MVRVNPPNSLSHTHRVLQHRLMTAAAMNQFTNSQQKAFTAMDAKIRIRNSTNFLHAIRPQRQFDRHTRSNHLRRLTTNRR